nr:homeodomain-containing protein [Tanacetum cinerariifolium]
FPKNNVEVLKILKNKLESLKLQENQPEYRSTGGIGQNFGSRSHVGVGSFSFFDKIKPKRFEIAENHREEEDQEGNNSSDIETLTYHFFIVAETERASTSKEQAKGREGAESTATTKKVYSDDEDLINLDIDDDVSRCCTGHGGDGGGDDRPPPYQIPTGCGGCLGNRGKGTTKPNLGGRRAGTMHTCQETRNLGLKAITDKNGPVSIRFEFGDRETGMPLGDHAARWANYLGELVRELSLHYTSWRQMLPEQKADPMESSATREYPSLIHTFFLTHTVGGIFLNPVDKALYDEMLRLRGLGSNTPWLESQPEHGGGSEIGGCEPGDDEDSGEDEEDERMPIVRRCWMESSATREYSSLGDEMLRLWGLGSNTPRDEMLRLWGLGSNTPRLESQPEYGGGSEIGGCEPGDDEDGGEDEEDERMPIVRRCWENIGLYLADNASFVTSSPAL